MAKGIAITGMGIISALGNGVEENYRSLATGKSGLSYPEFLPTLHTNLPVGEVKLSDDALAGQLALLAGHSCTRAALLGAIAVKQAIEQAGLSTENLQSTGLISGTSVGGMDYTEKYFKEFEDDKASRRFIRAQHPGFTTARIAEIGRIGGSTTTISSACSSSANSIMLGARMIKAGKLKRVIVGGTDCLSRFTLNGFNSLMILSHQACKPFDENRNGLNLGEGAAFLVLEAEENLKDKAILGRISGYGNANDAYHQTALSENGEGAFLAMEKALDVAHLTPDEIDYINAHGTATQNNDLSESMALARIFEKSLPPFSSTKAFTGHTLGAAGALEAVFSLFSLEKGKIFPNLNYEKAIRETALEPSLRLEDKMMSHILSNSFGFGGNCTSLIISKNEE